MPGQAPGSVIRGGLRTVNILGVWDGHDSGAALLVDGRLAVAVNEERFTRRKLEVRFPAQAIAVCLEQAGIDAAGIDAAAVSTSDVAKTLSRWFPSTKERYYRVRGARLRQTGWDRSSGERSIRSRLGDRTVSPGAEPTCVSTGARDEWYLHLAPAAARSSRVSRLLRRPPRRRRVNHRPHNRWRRRRAVCHHRLFRRNRLDRLAWSPAAHSLGVFFEHVTTLLNMRELEDEGKVMALAEYAAPVADEENPLLSLFTVQDGRVQCACSSAGLIRELRRVHWRSANEQFAVHGPTRG